MTEYFNLKPFIYPNVNISNDITSMIIFIDKYNKVKPIYYLTTINKRSQLQQSDISEQYILDSTNSSELCKGITYFTSARNNSIFEFYYIEDDETKIFSICNYECQKKKLEIDLVCGSGGGAVKFINYIDEFLNFHDYHVDIIWLKSIQHSVFSHFNNGFIFDGTFEHTNNKFVTNTYGSIFDTYIYHSHKNTFF